MNKFIVLLVAVLLGGFALHSTTSNYSDPEKVITGYIIEELTDKKRFYIQDNESGDFVQLKFTNEYLYELSFEDFDEVEVIGSFCRKTNKLTVDEIFMLDEIISNESFAELAKQ